MRVLLPLVISFVSACSGTGDHSGADGGTDAGPDAGLAAPAEFPLVRMDNPQSGTSHVFNWAGIVDTHGPARDIPAAFNVVPARQITIRDTAGATRTLFYTLPPGRFFASAPGDQVKLLYRENNAAAGVSSYATKITEVTGELRVIIEDGAFGPSLTEAERLGFTFTPDLGQPLGREDFDCGRRVHYPVVVKNGDKSKRLFSGQSEPFTAAGGEAVVFTFIDAYRIEESLCGSAPALSIGYLVTPAQ